MTASASSDAHDGPLARLAKRWHETPLYLRILGGVILGVIVGGLLGNVLPAAVDAVLPPTPPKVKQVPAEPPAKAGEDADRTAEDSSAKNAAARGQAPTRGQALARQILFALETPSKLVLRLLGALASPLILLAVIQALMHAQLPKGSALRLVSLLALNTLVAIGIGLAVANLVQPGRWTKIEVSPAKEKPAAERNPLDLFLENIPRSVLGPFGDEGKVISVIILAVAFGIALRRL
jgi:Na+/H+-dicarboxylate symporter